MELTRVCAIFFKNEERAMQLSFLGVAAYGLLVFSACGGPMAFTRGEYSDPNEISMLDDKWNQNDMQLIAKKMVGSLSTWVDQRKIEKPVVILEMPRNRTAEHIDLESLYDHVKTSLIRSGKCTFLDKKARKEIAEEYDYQGSGYVLADEAQGPGNQRGARYLMGGVITSTIQEVGREKVIYYKATFELTDIATSEIIWTDHKEIAKHFKKRSVGF
jgi:uncharacterized protein (TIGR02722 family)